MEYETKYLRKLQLTELEILDEIKRICEKFSLRYCLIGGTLLGAVRHKGFIPWDDDLDIVMPRSDYEKFCEVCSTELDKKYYLHNINTDKKYWLAFAKIRKHNTIFDEKNISHLNVKKGIYVDVFPLDYSKGEDSKGQAFRTFFIKQLSACIINKIGIRPSKENKKGRFFCFLRLCLSFPFSIRCLTKIQNWLMKQGRGNSYVNFGSNYNTKKQTMPISFFEPYIKIEFEGNYYNAPCQYEKVLARIYGNNFMELPPLEKRTTHRPVRIIFGDEGVENNE